MLRRGHKKSRRGCLECKRRHVKCDEGRPKCFQCTLSERDCSYASQASSIAASTSGTPLHERLRNTRDKHRHLLNVTPLTTSPFDPNSSECENAREDHDPTLDEAINLNHMELLIHLILNKDMFNLGGPIDDSWHSLAFNACLQAPYLFHQVLAFSARHLAFLHPERSASYLHQAIALQTRAVSIFNATSPEVDQSNCVAILLFSSVLGHHILADTLTKRDPGGLEAFLTHFTQCLVMNRGVYAIAIPAWPLLMQTRIESILSVSEELTSRSARGDDCQQIRALVDGAESLGEEEKEACQQAIQYLQVGFDALLVEEEPYNQYQMFVLWTMLVPPEFTALLASKRPEALAVLGYYALLLHSGRIMWQVGDAGAYILGIISDYLDLEWDHWLEYPRIEISKTL